MKYYFLITAVITMVNVTRPVRMVITHERIHLKCATELFVCIGYVFCHRQKSNHFQR